VTSTRALGLVFSEAARRPPVSDGFQVVPDGQHDLFHWYRVALPAVSLQPQVSLVHAGSDTVRPGSLGRCFRGGPSPFRLRR